MKWKCKKDVVLFGKKLAEKDDLIIEGQTLDNGSISITIDQELLSNNDLFEKIEGIQVSSKDFEPSSEDIEKEWIIELKVKTTRKNLRRIEQFIQSEVEKMI
jgi:hypothetical protein